LLSQAPALPLLELLLLVLAVPLLVLPLLVTVVVIVLPVVVLLPPPPPPLPPFPPPEELPQATSAAAETRNVHSAQDFMLLTSTEGTRVDAHDPARTSIGPESRRGPTGAPRARQHCCCPS
jgi:hypothetical protein